MSKLATGILVGGDSRPSSDGAFIEVRDPANGQVIATVADGTVVDALSCVEAAATASETVA